MTSERLPILVGAAREGAVEGWWYGKRFALWAAAVSLLAGPRPFSNLGLSFGAVTLVYLVGGVTIGAIGGGLTALAPRCLPWRLLAGFVSVLPAALACAALIIPRPLWADHLVPTALGSSAILGVGGALIFMEKL